MKYKFKETDGKSSLQRSSNEMEPTYIPGRGNHRDSGNNVGRA